MTVIGAIRGAAPAAGPSLTELQWSTAILIGALLLGALVIAWVARWRRRGRGAGLNPSDQLAEFRNLYLEGAISKEEFERLRAVLGPQIRGTAGRSEKADNPPAPPAPPPSANGPGAPPPANGVQPG